MDEVAFVQNLLEATDDAPFMIYADYLKERGNPLGEYVDLQRKLLRGDDRISEIQYNFYKIKPSFTSKNVGQWLSEKSHIPTDASPSRVHRKEISWTSRDERVLYMPQHRLLAYIKKKVTSDEIRLLDRAGNVAYSFENRAIWYSERQYVNGGRYTADAPWYYILRSIGMNATEFLDFLRSNVAIGAKDLPEELLLPVTLCATDHQFDVNRVRPAGEPVRGTHVFIWDGQCWLRRNIHPVGSYRDAFTWAKLYTTTASAVVVQETEEKYRLRKLAWKVKTKKKTWYQGGKTEERESFKVEANIGHKVEEKHFKKAAKECAIDDFDFFNLTNHENLRKLVGGV